MEENYMYSFCAKVKERIDIRLNTRVGKTLIRLDRY